MADDEDKPNPDSSREDAKGELRDSLSKRFEPMSQSQSKPDQQDKRDNHEQHNNNDIIDKRDSHTERENHDKRAKRDSRDQWVSAQNVKDEWDNVLMYLPPDTVRSDLNDGWSRCQLNYDLDLKKTRHYYPAVLLAGLEAIEDMPQEEFEQLLEQIE